MRDQDKIKDVDTKIDAPLSPNGISVIYTHLNLQTSTSLSIQTPYFNTLPLRSSTIPRTHPTAHPPTPPPPPPPPTPHNHKHELQPLLQSPNNRQREPAQRCSSQGQRIAGSYPGVRIRDRACEWGDGEWDSGGAV